jgi:hypothetical protein
MPENPSLECGITQRQLEVSNLWGPLEGAAFLLPRCYSALVSPPSSPWLKSRNTSRSKRSRRSLRSVTRGATGAKNEAETGVPIVLRALADDCPNRVRARSASVRPELPRPVANLFAEVP